MEHKVTSQHQAHPPIVKSGVSWGKTILFGEHVVVHGGVAAALPLRDLPLKVEVSFGSRPFEATQWEVEVCGDPWPLAAPYERQFSEALQMAWGLINRQCPPIEKVKIVSQIPLGGGLGGSAALSSALLKIVTQENPLPQSEFLKLANALDGFFHGKASGLDVAAVNAQGPIGFETEKVPWPLEVGFSFQIVLVDTGVRTPTAQMVLGVKENLWQKNVQMALENLRCLSKEGLEVLKRGSLHDLQKTIQGCQKELHALGVSHPENNRWVQILESKGCLAAKLTGGGGGGMVLGLLAPSASLPEVGTRLLCSQVRSTV